MAFAREGPNIDIPERPHKIASMKPLVPAFLLCAMVIGLAGLRAMAAAPKAPAEPEALVKLREQFRVAQAQTDQSMATFIANYTRSLDEAKNAAQKQGNLDGVLAVDAEIKKARSGSIGQNSTYPPVQDLQKAFAKQYAEAQKDEAVWKQKLAATYAVALGDLQKSLTQAGDLDGAMAVRKEYEKVSKNTAETSSVAEEPHFVGKRWTTGSGSRFTFHADGTGFQESDGEGRANFKWKKGDNNLVVVDGESAGHRKATYYFRFSDVKSGVFGTTPNKMNRVISLK